MTHEMSGLSVETIVTGDWKENCYVITDRASGDVAIIDPGDDFDLISPKVTVPGTQVRHILITHGHYDHVGAVVALSEDTGVPCSIHENDLALLRRAPLYALALIKKQILAPQLITPFAGTQAFPIGDFAINAWPTPGHTAGSVCFQISGCVFTGDTLFREKTGRTDVPGGSRDDLAGSMGFLMSHLEDDTLILPGHGQSWNQEEARAWWDSGAVAVESDDEAAW